MHGFWVRVIGGFAEIIKKPFANGTLGSVEVVQGTTRNGESTVGA